MTPPDLKRCLACLLAIAVGVGTPARAADRFGAEKLTLIVSAELDGHLADPSCRPGEGHGQTLGHLAAAAQLARRSAEAEGREVVAVVHLGDFTGPAALSRFLLAREGGPEELARLAARTGFTHAIMGDNMLDQRPEVIARLARALPDRGLQLLNANIACEGRADCEALAGLPAQVRLDLPGLPIALIGTTGDGVLRSVNPVDRKGLELQPLAQTLEEQAARARAHGAALVLAATHSPDGSDGFELLASSLRDVTGVDLLVANHMGRLSDAAATVQPLFGPTMALSGRTPLSVVRMDFELENGAGGQRIRDLRATRVSAIWPDAGIDAEVRRLTRDFCQAFDKPLNAIAHRAVSPRWFLGYLLDEMRLTAEAEVAVVNEGIVDAAAFPLLGKVTTADIYAALPYEDEVVQATIPGARLRAMWKLDSSRTTSGRRLAWAGIDERGGTVYVNDRPLEDGSRYRVVLPDYVARGGGGLIGAALEFEVIKRDDGSVLGLRELLLTRLGEAKTTVRLSEPRVLDLARKPRWRWSGQVTLGANDARRSNRPNYSEPRLQREPSSALRGEAGGLVEADTLDHALRLTGRSRYAQTSVGGEEATETEDEIFTEALYQMRGLRRYLGNKWYAPVPSTSFTMRTEFARDDGEAYRRLALAGTIGMRLLPVRPLELKVGLSLRREHVIDPERPAHLGLEVGYELPRFSPLKLRGLPVFVESGLDYFLPMSGEQQHVGRVRARVLLPLGGPLAVSVDYHGLAIRGDGQPFGFASDVALGITAQLDGARQQF